MTTLQNDRMKGRQDDTKKRHCGGGVLNIRESTRGVLEN